MKGKFVKQYKLSTNLPFILFQANEICVNGNITIKPINLADTHKSHTHLI